MHVPTRVVRRIGLPLYLVFFAVLIGIFVIGLVIGTLSAPFGSRRRLFRISGFGLCYLLMELSVIAVAGALWIVDLPRRVTGHHNPQRWHQRHSAVLRLALSWVIGAAIRFAGFELVVSEKSTLALSEAEPNLVLARHGGPGDSFVLVHLLLTKYGHDVRIVLKEALQFDPALDIVLNRLGCCFLPVHAGVQTVGAIAASLKPGDALLLFPEGGNWTPKRRLTAIRRLQSRHQLEDVRTAELMPHVLPPRLGGVVACLDAQPNVQVVVAAHAGLDQLVTAGQLWANLPFTQPMTARIWQASPPPDDEAARAQWLMTEWAIVDEWIDAYHAHEIDRVTPTE